MSSPGQTPRDWGWELQNTADTPRSMLMPMVSPGYTDKDLQLQREDTADLHNDPRFFTGNVIDKRLQAFGSLAIVSGLIVGTAAGNLFVLQKNIDLFGKFWLVGWAQLIGFVLTALVVFTAMIATSVLSLQKWFTYRLMTAGPTGFEVAAEFYKDARMIRWRKVAFFCVKWNLPVFLLSLAFICFTKFYKEGARASLDHVVIYSSCYDMIAGGVFMLFVVAAATLFWIVSQHSQVFDQLYTTMAHPVLIEMRYASPQSSRMQRKPIV